MNPQNLKVSVTVDEKLHQGEIAHLERSGLNPDDYVAVELPILQMGIQTAGEGILLQGVAAFPTAVAKHPPSKLIMHDQKYMEKFFADLGMTCASMRLTFKRSELAGVDQRPSRLNLPGLPVDEVAPAAPRKKDL